MKASHTFSSAHPWALFNAPGNAVVQTTDQFTLPTSPAAVPYVELRLDEEVIAQSMPVKSTLFRYEAADRVVMPGPYEAQPAELGGLLLHLGRALGARAPQGWAPPEAHPPEPAYSSRRTTVRLRFLRAEYAEKVAQLQQ